MSIVATGSDASSLRSASSKRRGDATFKAITLLAGALVFVLLGAIAVFLVVKAIPALQADKSSFWTTQIWDPDGTVQIAGSRKSTRSKPSTERARCRSAAATSPAARWASPTHRS